mgnify:FL=1
MKKRVVSWILVLCTALALVGCGQNQNSAASSGQGSGAGTAGSGDGSGGLENSYSFNVGSSSTAGTTITKTFEAAQQKAQEESGGKLTMTYYGASSLGSDNEMLKECVAGNLPIVVMTTASITGTVPELAVFDMHCAFSSMDTLSAMMEDEEFLAMVQGWFEKAGLKLIAWETQSSKLLASTKEVNTIDDFKGYDMRTLSNKYHIDFWQAVGANTIQIDASELYLSVQQGLINGIEMNMASILSRKLTEVCDYVQETMILPHMTIAVMNLDQYNSMAENDKAWFDQFMAEVNDKFNAMGIEDNEAGWDEVAAAGVTAKMFNEELFEDLKAVAETSSWKLVREDLGDEVVDAYLAKIAEYES